MKAATSVTVLLLSVLGQCHFAEAQEEVRTKPVDVYFSVLGGYSFPFKTDMSFSNAEVWGVKFEHGSSLGGKMGMWIFSSSKDLEDCCRS